MSVPSVHVSFLGARGRRRLQLMVSDGEEDGGEEGDGEDVDGLISLQKAKRKC